MFGRSKGPDRSGRSELASAIHDCRRALGAIVVFSGVMNILTLTGPLFMLQIYDRVVPSQSIPTLIGLAAITALLYASLGFLDQMRARILIRIGAYVDEVIHPKIFRAIVTLPLRNALPGDGLQPLRDLDQIRSFISGGGPAAFADLPFLPFQILICFLIDPLIGYAVIVGAVIIFFLTLLTDVTVRKASEEASARSSERFAVIESSRRNAEVLRALGMGRRLAERWGDVNRSYEASHQTVMERSGTYSGISKVFRMMFQSALLGLGAYLVIVDHASFGVIIAASILGARALQPIEMLVANWKGFVASRQAWSRLTRLLAQFPETEEPMPLPAPKTTLKVENLAVVPPGSNRPSVVDVNFALQGGNALGVIGPSGAGKSSLVRVVIGAWAPARGRIRLDGAALEQWHPDTLGKHVGYLPQDVELFNASIRENISRFQEADPNDIVEAAKLAGVHDLILRLPNGYETKIGTSNYILSGGQRQRIGLARALFGNPRVLVLDEPNANLDTEGEAALRQALVHCKEKGVTVIVIAHRPSILSNVDKMLFMRDGQVELFGPPAEVMARLSPPGGGARPRVVSAQQAAGGRPAAGTEVATP